MIVITDVEPIDDDEACVDCHRHLRSGDRSYPDLCVDCVRDAHRDRRGR